MLLAIPVLGSSQPSGQQSEPVRQPRRDLSRREHPHTRRRQFDSRRDPIQMPAGLGHGMSIAIIDPKRRVHEPDSHLEQPRLSATTRTGQRHHAGFREQVRHLGAVTAAADERRYPDGNSALRQNRLDPGLTTRARLRSDTDHVVWR